jgi:hypothetical protein
MPSFAADDPELMARLLKLIPEAQLVAECRASGVDPARVVGRTANIVATISQLAAAQPAASQADGAQRPPGQPSPPEAGGRAGGPEAIDDEESEFEEENEDQEMAEELDILFNAQDEATVPKAKVLALIGKAKAKAGSPKAKIRKEKKALA